jgi:hypothetical protein
MTQGDGVIGIKDALELLEGREEALQKRVLLSSGLALLLAAVSRLPSWEVAAPVSWLVGSVNVGFLPIFGPILVLGTSCFTFLALREFVDLRKAILERAGNASQPADALVFAISPSARGATSQTDRVLWSALFVQKLWVFVVPVVAYVVLFASYLDFVRPKCDDAARAECLEWAHTEGWMQKLDLAVGVGGWSGFRPLTPSIQTALRKRAEAAAGADESVERQRLLSIADTIPWIYPPLQTWAYAAGLLIVAWLGWHGWREYEGVHKTRARKRRR